MSLLPMLLSTPPQLTTVTLAKDVTDGKGTTIITAQNKLVTGYGAGGNQMMPLLLLMMAGGLGDSKSGGGDDQSLMLLALVLMGNPQTGREDMSGSRFVMGRLLAQSAGISDAQRANTYGLASAFVGSSLPGLLVVRQVAANEAA